ncbi:MAG: sugar phosphate isomerase/epimerase [Candidatus Eisenbacteria bacterium]|nr:sugar phosphate isomerase/epimerase [Candidatus Eisenbacteria bacterium]
MKFGASTLMKGRVEEFFDGAKDSFEAVEIVCDSPYATPLDINTRFLQSVRKALGVEYTVHSPFTSTDIGALDYSLRKQSVGRILEAIEVGSVIEASIIVVHPSPGTRGSIEEREKIRALEKESLEEIHIFARPRGIRVCVENMPSGFPFLDRSLASGVMHLVEGLEGAGVTFDVGHANTTTVLPEKMLEHFGRDLVAHVHVHDNRGVRDDHLEIGKGNIHWREVVTRLVEVQYQGILMDESLNIEAAKRGIRFLKKLFEEVEKLAGSR